MKSKASTLTVRLVAGTFNERQSMVKEMSEQLIGRVIRASSHDGDTVFDPITGSGTTLAVAQKLGRQFDGCELSNNYVSCAIDRLKWINVGDQLHGSDDATTGALRPALQQLTVRTEKFQMLDEAPRNASAV